VQEIIRHVIHPVQPVAVAYDVNKQFKAVRPNLQLAVCSGDNDDQPTTLMTSTFYGARKRQQCSYGAESTIRKPASQCDLKHVSGRKKCKPADTPIKIF
jgi:hypothetical protein